MGYRAIVMHYFMLIQKFKCTETAYVKLSFIGQVMHVKGKNIGIFSKAVLEFSFPQDTALWCQIR